MDWQDNRVGMLGSSLVILLNLSIEKDFRQADLIVKNYFSIRDLSFNPDYQACLGRAFNWKVCLLYFKTGEAHFIKYVRMVEVNDNGINYGVDFYSTYGHGGWLCSEEHSLEQIKRLDCAEKRFFEKNNVICEYCEVLQHSTPTIDMLLHPQDFVRKKPVIWLDLTAPLEVIWSSVQEKQRKAIVSSLKKGVYIKADGSSLEKVQRFERDYSNFLTAKRANSFWHFPSGFFEKFYKNLSSDQVFCFDAMWNGRTIGSFYALTISGCVYYFFSHSNPDYKSLNCNSSLMWFLIMNAKAKGHHSLYFGGGLQDGENDPLYKFKKSFGGNAKDYYVMKRVVNSALYQRVLGLIDPKLLEVNIFPPYLAAGKVR